MPFISVKTERSRNLRRIRRNRLGSNRKSCCRVRGKWLSFLLKPCADLEPLLLKHCFIEFTTEFQHLLWIAFRLHSSRNLLPSRFVCIHVVTPLRSTDERDI